jgi:hypothetical protein
MQTDRQPNESTYRLLPHPAACQPLAVRSVEARVLASGGPWLQLRWRIEGARSIVVPPFAGKGRADNLWRRTCFEIFLRPDGGTAYAEFNLSPTDQWAAYDFDSHREGMRDRPMPRDPVCTWRRGGSVAIFDAAIPLGGLPSGPCAMQLTAVIEEEGEDGARSQSCWAITHRPDKPDFHDQACFTGRLPAPAQR